MSTLKEAILDYLQVVESGLVLFDQKFETRDILKAWHKGALPKDGRLSDDVEYELHGVGCHIFFPEFDVDFDFAPDNRIDGFDSWRLWKYVRQFEARYPEFQDKRRLETAFEEMMATGALVQKFAPQCQLYFLEQFGKA